MNYIQEEEWDEISAKAKVFIRGLLNADPKKRLDATQALKDEWLNSSN